MAPFTDGRGILISATLRRGTYKKKEEVEDKKHEYCERKMNFILNNL